MPAGKTVKWGVWEDGVFIGAVIFSWGANNNIGKGYGLKQIEVCELVRVALTDHKTPVSKIVSTAVDCLRKQSPGLRLLVSYADPREGHNGGIYQAMNWYYVGIPRQSKGAHYRINYPSGVKVVHGRSVRSKYGRESLIPYEWEYELGTEKHKYLYPLDRAMRKQIAPLAQPYPKRDTRPVNGDTLATSEAGRFDSEPGALEAN